jgi:hypothetical protein
MSELSEVLNKPLNLFMRSRNFLEVHISYLMEAPRDLEDKFI